MRFCLLLFLLVISCVAFSQTAYTVQTVPNPKTNSSFNYVSNPDALLNQNTVSEVNAILQQLEDSTTCQIAVTIVQSIGNEVPKEFATELFRFWGIGQASNDNGFLILVVMDQRRIEFEVGYGLEGILTDGICKRIQVQHMVPLMKEGNVDRAVLNGVSEVSKIVKNPKYRQEVYAGSDADFDQEKSFWRTTVDPIAILVFGVIYSIFLIGSIATFPKRFKKLPSYFQQQYSKSYSNTKVVALNIVFPIVIIVLQLTNGNFRVGEFRLFLYLFFTILLFEKRLRSDFYLKKGLQNQEAYDRYQEFDKSYRNWSIAAFVFPIPFLFFVLQNKKRLHVLRNTQPLTANGLQLNKLNEINDNAFLKAAQLTEENLKSVDYDVWVNDQESVIKNLRYENRFSKYTECKECFSKANFLAKNETLISATTSSTGSGLKTYTCKNCNHTSTITYTIAKISTSSSSSGGSGGGGGGGGSFGGGSSGGGGSGSSW